jgi:C-terminal processing protease CtpA/Prc
MYRLVYAGFEMPANTVQRLSDNTFIPFDPANTDYQQFKQAINYDTAQLEDADGNLMSPESAKAFVATLA